MQGESSMAMPMSEPVPVKIVVAGGFGVGKTTFVGAVSEIEPLTTEAAMTDLSVGVDDLSRGAVGAVVLLDTRRMSDGFAAIDFFEDRRLPFVVAVNVFDEAPLYPEPSLREALALSPDVPLVTCDARRDPSVIHVLVTLVEHSLRRATATYP